MKKVILLLVTCLGLFSCTDHKDLYDPNINPDPKPDDNPLGIVVPDGFDWSMMTTVDVTVKVDDKYNGQYYYIVEVYNENPAVSGTASLLAKGIAKQGENFSVKVNVAAALENLYVRKITPTGRTEVRTFDIINANAYCDFTINASGRSLASRSATEQDFVDMKVPNEDDYAIFPVSIPENAKEYVTGGGNGNWKIVKGGTYTINNWSYSGGNIYVETNEEVTIDPCYINGANIYIIEGKVTFSHVSDKESALNNKGIISIGKKAEVTFDYLQVQKAYLYNLGTLNIQSKHYPTIVYKINEAGELPGGQNTVNVALDIVEDSYFYNKGIATIAGLRTSGRNANILNDGKLNVGGTLILAADGHFINDGGCLIEEDTWIDNTSCSWLNNGNYETNNMNICAWNEFVRNNCFFKVNKMLSMNESIITMDGGTYAFAANLYMKNAKFILGSKSYLEIDAANLAYNRETSGHGIYGENNDFALVSFRSLEYGETWFGRNLLVDYEKKPSIASDQWGLGWEKTVKWGNDAQITKSECNPGYGNDPETPTNPDLPLEVETSKVYIYAMEDQWPSYGDYDMNDIVVRVMKGITTVENYVKCAKFEVWIEAVGANKTIGAAIQLDAITLDMLSMNVNGEMVKHDTESAISGFSLINSATNCSEAGQKKVVLPLFASANQLMGGNFVNVGEGKTEKARKVQVDLYFKEKAVKPEDLNYKKINFFITTDGSGSNRTEIHLPGYVPTDLANSSLFGEEEDNPSLPYYSLKGMSWGILLPISSWECPNERVNIKEKYPEFEGWITSGGVNNKNWYKHPSSFK